uniref:Fungal_trans domain-containing protein n=1 Tax=Heterorhabditis bacteriophora TaxID=37862 RepID=A0A1I7WCI2_HETBA
MIIAAETCIGRVWQEIRRVRERLSASERNRSYASTPTTYDLHHKAIIISTGDLLSAITYSYALELASFFELQKPFGGPPTKSDRTILLNTLRLLCSICLLVIMERI